MRVARVGDEPGQGRERRVLVDRLWPRGVSRTGAPLETWAKDVAPSPALRKWYGHAVERFEEFDRRYRDELTTSPAREALKELRHQADEADTVLLTAAKDLDHSAAAVLQAVLAGG